MTSQTRLLMAAAAAVEAQALPNSVRARLRATIPAWFPPYSPWILKPINPVRAIFFRLAVKAVWSPVRSSRAAIGSSSERANFRAVSWIRLCSSVSSKSILPPIQRPAFGESVSYPGGFGVGPEYRFHHLHNFAQRGIGAHAVEKTGHGVFGALAGQAQAVQSLADPSAVPLPAQFLKAIDLPLVSHRVHLYDRDGDGLLVQEIVHPDDGATVVIDFTLVGIGGIGDLALKKTSRDGREHTPDLLDAAEIIARLALHSVGKRLHKIGASQRVDTVGHPGLGRQDLLGPQGNGRRLF